ncbi:hypothetical protein GCM10025864_37750 [Luteimicrobium album]|uniref:MFS transporter n=1 Tax=Luteimicrobium album TaxID=1054550 RepID=A0ABQ6I5R3_9MICO|nr:hypothetical protein [Luteimicrobium album]GMA26016.1 hypothetical protein GCM10025864_37750 [Luteimicrobium album]
MPRRDPAGSRASSGRIAHVYLLVTVLVVAANLRGAITTVGPVIDDIGDDTGLSAGALGLLGAVPLLTFALVSPLVHSLARRLGAEPAVGLALWVLTVGPVLHRQNVQRLVAAGVLAGRDRYAGEPVAPARATA